MQSSNEDLVKAGIKRIDKSLSIGRPIRSNADPSCITSAPWWPIIILGRTKPDLARLALTFKGLIQSIRLHMSGLRNFRFKLKKIEAWSEGRFIALRLYDINRYPETANIHHRFITELCDFNGKVTYAHCGWEYGSIHSSSVHQSTDESNRSLPFIFINSDKGPLYLHIHILVQLDVQLLGLTQT